MNRVQIFWALFLAADRQWREENPVAARTRALAIVTVAVAVGVSLMLLAGR